jgi:hypothetical protein
MNATLTSPELTRADRCDRCGAAAQLVELDAVIEVSQVDA